MLLRRYLPSDREEVWQLHRLALESTDAYIGDSSLDDDLKEIEEVYLAQRGEFLVGLSGKRLVAMGALKEVTEDSAELKRMRVHPDYQRRGYGSEMLRQLEAKAKALGYKKLVLDTSSAQVAALHLYRTSGYTETGREGVRGLEVIFFEKSL